MSSIVAAPAVLSLQHGIKVDRLSRTFMLDLHSLGGLGSAVIVELLRQLH